jgi:hypothetical protein
LERSKTGLKELRHADNFASPARDVPLTKTAERKSGEPPLSNEGVGALQTFRDALIGLPLSDVWRGGGSSIFLQFGHLTPRTRHSGKPGNPTGELELMIQWSWRIESTSSILCGSWSEEHLWEPAFNLLRNKVIVEISIAGRLPEIVVALTEGLYVSSFMTAEGDPQWALFDRRGSTLRALSVQDGCLRLDDDPSPFS